MHWSVRLKLTQQGAIPVVAGIHLVQCDGQHYCSKINHLVSGSGGGEAATVLAVG